jgi:hypothetical protein
MRVSFRSFIFTKYTTDTGHLANTVFWWIRHCHDPLDNSVAKAFEVFSDSLVLMRVCAHYEAGICYDSVSRGIISPAACQVPSWAGECSRKTAWSVLKWTKTASEYLMWTYVNLVGNPIEMQREEFCFSSFFIIFPLSFFPLSLPYLYLVPASLP